MTIYLVATGFPSGQYHLKTRLEEIRLTVADGAKEIDIVINREMALTGNWKGKLKVGVFTYHVIHFKPIYMNEHFSSFGIPRRLDVFLFFNVVHFGHCIYSIQLPSQGCTMSLKPCERLVVLHT